MSHKATILIETERLDLLLPGVNDARKMNHYIQRNLKHFASSSPSQIGRYNEQYWERFFENIQQDFLQKKSFSVLLFKHNQYETIVGDINFNGVMRGVFQAGYLGYRLDKDFEGQGFMQEALKPVIDFLCVDFKIHRIMANYRPENIRSANVLMKLEFVKEGMAKDYLYLNNQWCDHILTSYTNKDYVVEEHA